MSNNNTLIQSYIKNKYFVSTIYRKASTCIEMYYYETIAFNFDKKTRKTKDIISVNDSGSFEDLAIENHLKICKDLINNE